MQSNAALLGRRCDHQLQRIRGLISSRLPAFPRPQNVPFCPIMSPFSGLFVIILLRCRLRIGRRIKAASGLSRRRRSGVLSRAMYEQVLPIIRAAREAGESLQGIAERFERSRDGHRPLVSMESGAGQATADNDCHAVAYLNRCSRCRTSIRSAKTQPNRP